MTGLMCGDTKETSGQYGRPRDKHHGVIIDGHTESIIYIHKHTINSFPALERSHQFCDNNLNDFRRLSAALIVITHSLYLLLLSI